jgi:hypothetical protein
MFVGGGLLPQVSFAFYFSSWANGEPTTHVSSLRL